LASTAEKYLKPEVIRQEETPDLFRSSAIEGGPTEHGHGD
jgi:hypothetical protein